VIGVSLRFQAGLADPRSRNRESVAPRRLFGRLSAGAGPSIILFSEKNSLLRFIARQSHEMKDYSLYRPMVIS